ncbi:U1 snRNP-associated protein [Fusarium oxysporum f. sp. albedinis]|jgi:hypothetical protein|nr:U1 snRNP-associated protein [Fusarium oxysporum f. sp. albedinis]
MKPEMQKNCMSRKVQDKPPMLTMFRLINGNQNQAKALTWQPGQESLRAVQNDRPANFLGERRYVLARLRLHWPVDPNLLEQGLGCSACGIGPRQQR